MLFSRSRELNQVIVRGLKHLIDVDAGPTKEQQRLLTAFAVHVMGVDTEVIARESPLPAEALAIEIKDLGERRRFLQLAFMLSLSRHPGSENQFKRLQEVADALEFSGVELEIFEEQLHRCAAEATADFLRIYSQHMPDLSEQHGGMPSASGEVIYDDDFFAALEALQSCPHGSLGWSFVEFYRRNNMKLPGRDTPNPGYYVCHDMNHVITGYEPTGPGEIALGAFKLALHDSEANWLASLTNFLIHEVGLFKHGTNLQFVPYGGGGEPYHGIDGKRGALDLPGATELLAEALQRGSVCTGDFSLIDHLASAEVPLIEIRRQYNIVPLQHPMFDDAEFWPN